MIQRSGTGVDGIAKARGSGSSRMIAVIVSGPVARAKAFRPVTISYSIEPNENWSDRKSSGLPSVCSGDM